MKSESYDPCFSKYDTIIKLAHLQDLVSTFYHHIYHFLSYPKMFVCCPRRINLPKEKKEEKIISSLLRSLVSCIGLGIADLIMALARFPL